MIGANLEIDYQIGLGNSPQEWFGEWFRNWFKECSGEWFGDWFGEWLEEWFRNYFRNGLGIGLGMVLVMVQGWFGEIFALFFMPFLLITLEWRKQFNTVWQTCRIHPRKLIFQRRRFQVTK